MEGLQLSQVLADLGNLGAAEPEAAAAIVNANTREPVSASSSAAPAASPAQASSQTRGQPRQQKHQHQHQHQHQQDMRPSVLKSAWSTDPSGPVDKFGRRILITSPSPRSGSCTPGSETPRLDDDLERASTLMALYDIRSKLKQQDNSSLAKAREKINALAARQQAQQMSVQGRNNRYSYPKPGL
ncbi:hypothetical protein GMORB2_6161 [Geosmithia morbida]|uniref:Uncharacterized protein n=1 Tax=Geosmithia morbida TaxID=1094350 RepID=A0A9P4YWR0_9HYPO|nr:uncharacterized protein GMORB2_6161 [Geosmithia morbida]KAF4123460.1 hypothetical protein GMORB2_6161 [Geosmithia morbida]